MVYPILIEGIKEQSSNQFCSGYSRLAIADYRIQFIQFLRYLYIYQFITDKTQSIKMKSAFILLANLCARSFSKYL